MSTRFDRMYARDRQTDTHTDRRTPHDGIGRACIASCGKNFPLRPLSHNKRILNLLDPGKQTLPSRLIYYRSPVQMSRDPPDIPTGHLLPDSSPWAIFPPGHFSLPLYTDIPPSTTTIRRSTIESDLPLTCTKLIKVDRLDSEVRYSASFQIFALTAGRMF